MLTQRTRPRASTTAWTLLLSLIVAGCSAAVPSASVIAETSPSPTVTATASLPPPVAGEPCSRRAEVREGLSCVRGRSGLQWQARYAYQEQACDPEDKRIKQAGVILPRKGLKESRIAAACVYLEWLENADVELPTVSYFIEQPVDKTLLKQAQRSLTAGLRIFWQYRGYENINPALIVFTSQAELCSLGQRHLSESTYAWMLQEKSWGGGDANGAPFLFDCTNNDAFLERDGWCGNGSAGALPPGLSRDQQTAGALVSTCRESLKFGLPGVGHKFWQGIGWPGDGDLSFANALVNPDYLFSEYPGTIWAAEEYGGAPNLCGPGVRSWQSYTCKHDEMKGRLTSYQPSSTWWTAGALENGFSAEYMWARQTAMEWFAAHFGLDAAWLLPVALAGVTSESEYLAVLDSYTDWTHEQLFAGVDAWVAPQFGLTAP